MVTIQVTRDNRTGGEYDSKTDPPIDGRQYPNECPDIEVEVGVGRIYEGTDEPDDPTSADVGQVGTVVNDVPKWDVEKNDASGELLFKSGQEIALTDDEIQEAHDQAIEDARADAEPEYSNDD